MRPRHLPLLLVLLLLPTGCLTWEERICSEGEVPVYRVDNATGRDCIAEGTRPAEGYALFPAQRVPEEPNDRYDRWPLATDYPWPDEVSADVRREARRAER